MYALSFDEMLSIYVGLDLRTYEATLKKFYVNASDFMSRETR